MAKIRKLILGEAKNPKEKEIFHTITLAAFLAWVGLGADGLSSSCYGPEEAFLALGSHTYLGIFVAIASGLTILIIATSYSHIIELFPSGGGGYLVASKLLSPKAGMISGCALLIDYVLTITISIASGADAIFSFLPPSLYQFRLEFAVFGLLLLTVLNMRGIKEAVMPLVPIFILFVVLHLFAIVYAIFIHAHQIGEVYNNTTGMVKNSVSEIGIFGVFFLVMRAYSMGAGTFTGIEAVSNGLPILREPKVKTGKRTMVYMAGSLAFTVIGLMVAYLLFNVHHVPGKTLNAVLFQSLTAAWDKNTAYIFVFVILLTEAILLFIAAQAGFLDGPRVLASMAIDRWFPTRFSMLSDRLVTQNGILLMGGAALLMMFITRGSVKLLVVLYSINVFITFSLSQLGMVVHWWQVRKKEKILSKILINGTGLILTSFILVSVIILKFSEGGWLTLVITGLLVYLAIRIKKHYQKTTTLFTRLNTIIDSVEASVYNIEMGNTSPVNKKDRTAAILVNGFNGLGLHTLLTTIRMFGNTFKNYVFIQVGTIDAGNFKGTEELEKLEEHINEETAKYISFMKSNGINAEAFTSVGTDIVLEIEKLVPRVLAEYPNIMFFGGQLVFPRETFASRWLHNYIVFSIQKKLYSQGLPFIILPIRI